MACCTIYTYGDEERIGFETIPTASKATASTLTVPPPVQHDILLQCPICLKTETTQKACIYHILSKHPDYRFMCSTCSKQFSTFYAKYRHKKEHSEPAHICTECGKAYPFNSELERHMGVHAQILPFGCDLCDKCFAQKKSLKCHKVSHTDWSQTCPKCDKSFSTPDCFYTHYRGEHGKGYDTRCGKNYRWLAGRA